MPTLNFAPLEIGIRGDYALHFDKCAEKTSDYTFVNIWAWSDERKYEFAFSEGYFWPRVTSHGADYWAPVGDWESADWEGTLSRLFPDGMVFNRVPESLARIWMERLDGRIELEEQRSEWEYVYSVEELITLGGNRFHKKKNLLRQFMRDYEWEYRPVGGEGVEGILDMQQIWCEWKNCDDTPGLKAENQAIVRVLKNWDSLPGLMCGALYVKDVMVAYTVGEPMTEDMSVIHFEKGLSDYKGVYQAINQVFLERSCSGFKWVNREQDMGVEGVRKAKQSYNPARFLKKYLAKWKGK